MSLQPPQRSLNTRRGTIRGSIGFHSKHLASIAPTTHSENDSVTDYGKKDVILANTYKMNPDQKFLPAKTKEYMKSLLESRLQDLVYDDEKAKDLCLKLSEEIKSKVKENWLVNRYKVVCIVNIGKPFNQGLRITSRCLWNSAFDTYVSASFSTDKIFGMATVYAIYME